MSKLTVAVTSVAVSSFLLFGMIVPVPIAKAHSIHISYQVEEVEVEVYFGGGTAAQDTDVTVYDPDDNIYAEGKTDENGRFSFQPSARAGEWTVVAEHSGHRAEETIFGGTQVDDNSMPLYARIAAGLGYLVGIAGISIGYVAWKNRRRGNEDDTVS
ncbi:MAG: hypothetical protein SVY53_05615 [Chloroflexota bacterium]|nr:hypothetical protein [Chloroflexota bacterium]